MSRDLETRLDAALAAGDRDDVLRTARTRAEIAARLPLVPLGYKRALARMIDGALTQEQPRNVRPCLKRLERAGLIAREGRDGWTRTEFGRAASKTA